MGDEDDDDGEFFDAVSTPSPFKQSEFNAIDKSSDSKKNVEISEQTNVCNKKTAEDQTNDGTDIQCQHFSEESLFDIENECMVKNKIDIEDEEQKTKETEK